MRGNSGLGRIFAILCLLVFLGCGRSAYQTAPVSGRVTLDGRPLGSAHVSFQPVAAGNPNTGPGSFGRTDAEGRFRLETIGAHKDGAVVGKHIVRISPYQPEQDLKDDEVRPRDKTLPPQADDGSLRCDVPPGGTDHADFALTSKPSADRH